MLMKHPDFPDRDPIPTTLRAFDVAWAKRGWVLVDAVENIPAPIALADRTMVDLKKMASNLEITGRSNMSKEELVEAIQNHPGYFAGRVGDQVEEITS